MKKPVILFFFLILSNSFLFGEIGNKEKLDSLNEIIEKKAYDFEYLKALNTYVELFGESNPDSSLNMLKQGLALSKEK